MFRATKHDILNGSTQCDWLSGVSRDYLLYLYYPAAARRARNVKYRLRAT